MSYGWVDPDSVRLDGENVTGDFFKAKDGKRLVLRVPALNAKRLDGLLGAQAQHGIVFLDPSLDGLNAAETVRGTVRAENRTSGEADLSDGRKVVAEFPQGTFDEPGFYKFRGTGVVAHEGLSVFAADLVATDDPASRPGI